MKIFMHNDRVKYLTHGQAVKTIKSNLLYIAVMLRYFGLKLKHLKILSLKEPPSFISCLFRVGLFSVMWRLFRICRSKF